MKAVVVAAGASRRMNSSVPKSLLEYKGKRIANHVVTSFNEAGILDLIFVVNSSYKMLFEKYLPSGTSYAYQEHPTGAADAVYCARNFVEEQDLFLVGMADVLLKSSDLERLGRQDSFTITSVKIRGSERVGKIISDSSGNVTRVDKGDYTNCNAHTGYSLVNSGFLCSIPQVPIPNSEEKNIDSAFNYYIGQGGKIRELEVDWWKHFTYPEDLKKD